MNETSPMTIQERHLEELLERASKRGAKIALQSVGLDCDTAAADVHELRSLMQGLRLVKRTAAQTIVSIMIAGLLAALMIGLAVKLKLFGQP